MTRLWLSAFAIGTVALGSLGCTGQNIEGRWRGPFPLEGCKAGILNLYGDERFDLSCDHDLWIGGGRYSRDSGSLTLDFTILVRRGIRVDRLPSIKCGLEGRGNEIVLTQAGQTYPLERRLE